jgi:GAF domain-containing protein
MRTTPASTLADSEQLIADLQRQLAECRAERDEALEYQTATSDVLKVISRSTFDLQAVLDTLVESAARLCDADRAAIHRRLGDDYPFVASYGFPPEFEEFMRSRPFAPGKDTAFERAVLEAATIHIPDIKNAPAKARAAQQWRKIGGYRTVLAVPLMREGSVIGVVVLTRSAVRPFSAKQIELAETFADQAVIAIENVRLFDEVEARTRQLSEALEQQTATSEVLSVISSSPGELEPVFNAMLENATKLCDASFGAMWLHERDGFCTAAFHGDLPSSYTELWRSGNVFRPHPEAGLARLAKSRKPIQIADLREDQGYISGDALPVAAVDIAGIRTVVLVPMLKENELVGAISIYRKEVRAFSEKQIELVTSFARQAVIAIENTRLLNELRESLQQQTATADVLKVISRSTFDLQAVLNTLTESATKLCAVDQGVIFLRDGDVLRMRASFGFPPEAVEYALAHPMLPNRGSATGRVALEGRPVHIHDVLADPEYSVAEYQRTFGYRTVLSVPLLREGATIGVFALTRSVVEPFSDKQIELATTFADQAVIAIENVRLFEQVQKRTDELTESLRQQTATAEVLKVISRSTFDLQAVLDTLVKSAAQLCEADMAAIVRVQGSTYRHAASFGYTAEVHRQMSNFQFEPGRGTVAGRVVLEGQVVQVADIQTDSDFTLGLGEPMRAAGWRTMLGVPLMREGTPIGVVVLIRCVVREFTAKQIELVTTFADQAVIAIENVRLFDEVQARTRELSESLEQQTATSEVLSVISTTTGNLQPVFETLLGNATRLCDGNYGAMWLWEGDAFRVAALHGELPPAYIEQWRSGTLFRPGPGVPMARVASTRQPVHVPDMRADPGYLARDPLPVSVVEVAGVRSLFSVPMLRENEFVGVITIYRKEVRPFTDKQVELVRNFAAQAVIAIENTRLLNELRESLEQQTATSEVLQVISSSPGELGPVFNIVLENAIRTCQAEFGNLFLREDAAFRAVAVHGDSEYIRNFRHDPIVPDHPGTPLERLTRTKVVIHVADIRKEDAYVEGFRPFRALAEVGGARTLLVVPMLKEGDLLGAIAMYSKEVRPFTDKQIELVKNFAAQAVIAIENTRLLSELRESLEQQTATSEVLQVISSSPGELQPVFDAMLANATRTCAANCGVLFLHENGAFRAVALHGAAPPSFVEARRRNPVMPAVPGTALGRLLATKKTVQIEDVRAEPAYSTSLSHAKGIETGDIRTVLSVPMLKEDELIGAFNLFRHEVLPFTAKQIELVTAFARQAVIAIENTRLLNELRESLQQQTATSEVLSVISGSPGELEPVFEAMLANATRLCEASYGLMYLCEGDSLRMAALHGDLPEVFKEQWRYGKLFRPDPDIAPARAVRTREVVHIADLREDRAYLSGDPLPVAGVEVAGIRTIVVIPMLKENEPVGAISIYRKEVRPFTGKQIELVQNFAKQAVIAIENTRLLNELRESLQQQTATADVLQVISRSAFDLQPVFQAVAESSVKLCGADKAFIFRFDGELLRMVAAYNSPQEFTQWVAAHPIRPGHHSGSARAALERRTIHIPDVRADPEYSYGAKDVENIRTILGVPILKGKELLGVIMIYRLEVKPFTDKQIALVETFADQASIAIENVRLFEEIQARTRELTQSVGELRALGEVTQAVSSTLDLQTVLDTIVAKASQLSGTECGVIYVFDQVSRQFELRATYGMTPEMVAVITEHHADFSEAVRLATQRREPDQVADLEPSSRANELVMHLGYRARLVVPLLSSDQIVGALVVRRKASGEFPKSTIELLQTFAAQSVLAIQNARLFDSVETRTRELAKSLEDLRTAQDRLVQTEKLASLGQLTAGIAHEIKNPLNFVNNFSAVSVELVDELREALAGAHLDNKLRAEISELADMLQGNLDKVVQHGKRADSIVKNMLLHSRQGSGEHRPVDINALVEESLNLAYHGARAEKQGFNITLERSFDPSAGEVDLFPQEITRVLLNLISNGFYAATKRKAEGNGGDYEPTLFAATRSIGDGVEIRIRDNGTGIPPEVREKMFNPFFTTKPAGEGTGLGLSLSHDIIVKQHGGSIEVDTMPGEYTEFTIFLPRHAASTAKSGERN